MLLLTKGNTGDKIVMTLNEKTTITNPYYLMVVEHITTKEAIRFVLGADLSTYPERFNEFAINTPSVFTTHTLGQWLYRVYEQSSPTNTDETGLNMVENGKLNYQDNQVFTYQNYEPSTTFKAYAG